MQSTIIFNFLLAWVGSGILEFDRLLARNLVTVTALAVGLAAIINLESFR
jgi:hypothetical protein